MDFKNEVTAPEYLKILDEVYKTKREREEDEDIPQVKRLKQENNIDYIDLTHL